MMQRALSLIIALFYLLWIYTATGRGEMVLKTLGFLVLCLACIWFGEEMGSYTGYTGLGRKISRTTPGSMVVFMGWVLLLLPAGRDPDKAFSLRHVSC